MTRPRRVLTGTITTVVAQFLVALLSLGYTAVTARILAPNAFGDFAIALSLMGILVLVTSTGTPSQLLRTPTLGPGSVTRARIASAALGGAGALTFAVLAPHLYSFLGASGAQRFTLLLCINILLSPTAAGESALLRREGRNSTDAVVLFVTNAVASGSVAVAVIATRAEFLLALPILIVSTLTIVVTTLLRRDRYRIAFEPSNGFRRFAVIVTWQNLLFYLIYALPTWIASSFCGVAMLGQLSRSATLTTAPAASVTSALNRGLQGHWRHISEFNRQSLAISDVTVCAAFFSFVTFGTLAVASQDLVNLWLGPGWEVASRLAVLLAIACAFQVPYGVLSNALEMVAAFPSVRWSQVGMLLSVIPLLFVVLTKSIFLVATATLVAQICGLVALIFSSGLHSSSLRRNLLGGLASTLLVSSLPISAAVAVQVALSAGVGGVSSAGRLLITMCVSLAVGIAVLSRTRAWRVVIRRYRVETSKH